MNLKLIWHHMSARKKSDFAFGSALAVIISGPFLLAIVSNIWTSLLDGSHEDIVDGIFSLLGFGALLVFIGGVVVFIAYLGKLDRMIATGHQTSSGQRWPATSAFGTTRRDGAASQSSPGCGVISTSRSPSIISVTIECPTHLIPR